MSMVGQKVKEFRERKGISQSELARRAGVSQAGLSALENETKSPTLQTVELIAHALDVQVASLLDEKIDVESLVVSKQEYELVSAFRGLTDTGKMAAINQVSALINVFPLNPRESRFTYDYLDHSTEIFRLNESGVESPAEQKGKKKALRDRREG